MVMESTKKRKERWIEASIVCALFVLAACVGGVYQASWGGVPQFWQNTTFMQGILWTCGHGFENPKVSEVPGLEEFIDYRTDCFDCAAIPSQVPVLPRDTRGMSFEEIGAYHPQPQFAGFLAWQRYHLYLVLAVTCCWWLMGVCWSALTPLAALLYGMTVCAAYGLFRLGMRRTLAACCAVWLMVSPIHLQMVPHLRDYAKAPFLLIALLIIGHLIKHSPKLPRFWAWSILCGAVIGIGTGFRTDLAIAFPGVLVLMLFVRQGLRTRLGAMALFALAFAGAGYPILHEVFREAGHFCHVALLGFLTYCDDRLGVNAGWYHLGGPYSDFYIANVVQCYMERMHGTMPATHVMMPEYHEATQHFFREYVRVFPGDLIIRAYASVLRVLDEMRIDPAHPYPMGLSNQFLCRIYEWRALLLDHVPGGGRYYALAAVLLLACVNLRWAFAALFVLLYFGGYPAIQFNLRHAFHLEFLVLWAGGFLVQNLFYIVTAAQPRGPENALSRLSFGRAAIRCAVFAAVSGAALATLVSAACAYQYFTVGRLVGQTAALPLYEIPHEQDPAREGGILIRFPGFAQPDPAVPVKGAYLMLELKGADAVIPVTVVYEAEDHEHFDYTRTINAALGKHGGPTRLYIPLYYSLQSRFVGLRIPEGDADRVMRVCRVEEAETLPVWMTLCLPSDWNTLPRHQVLTR